MGEALQAHLTVHRGKIVGELALLGRQARQLEGTGVRGGGPMSRRVAGPTAKLTVDDAGTGEAVLLVHSLAGNTGHWAGQLEHLRKTRRAVALDLRGHGHSDPPKQGEYSIEAQSEDVGAVADFLGLERFAVVGHSMGAGVALAYAGAHPDRVTHLLLADPIGDGTQTPEAEVRPFLDALDSPGYTETIEGYWSSIAGSDGAVLDRLLRDLRATPRETMVRGLHAVMAFDPKPALARFRGPTLAVVTPENDFPYSMHRLGPGLPQRVITGTGHWLQIERPAEFNRILERFLQE
ncbi:MAG: alpha/beta hydrolase [Gemmatimonadales bacterium]|nr:alpha/beta hydrolase [Gemmatimonadales bacterium]